MHVEHALQRGERVRGGLDGQVSGGQRRFELREIGIEGHRVWRRGDAAGAPTRKRPLRFILRWEQRERTDLFGVQDASRGVFAPQTLIIG